MLLGIHPSNSLGPMGFRDLAWAVATSRPDEIACDECFEQLARFVDLILASRHGAQAMPLVQDHLDRCADCREEFESILLSLGAVA